MSSDTHTRRSGTRPSRRPTTLLLGIGIYAILSAALLWQVERIPTAVRIPLALPLLLFVPGYAVLAALFPLSRGSGVDRLSPHENPELRFSFLERAVLAVVTSIAIVPGVAVVANAVTGVRLGPVLAGVVVVTVLGVAVGIFRSSSGPVGSTGASGRGGSIVARLRHSLADPVTIVAVVLCVALLGSSAALAVVGGGGADSPGTEFYAVEDAGAGAGAGGYEIRIAQDEVSTQRYTVVVMLDRQGGGATGSSSELDRFSTTVAAGETATVSYGVPSSAPDGAALDVLLYRGDAPADPDRRSAHRALRLSVGPSA